MSSPLPMEEHEPETSDHLKQASPAAVPPDDLTSKDTVPAAEQTHDGTKFAFDETLFGSMPLMRGTAIEDDDSEIPYPDAGEESLLPPPPDFKPFFTLIEDGTTGEHQHPTVHYLFADDDQEILTAAALETLSDEHRGSEEEERFVVVDVSADGRNVRAISSLSPEWQTLKTKVTQAPSWGDESNNGDRGLMLRISGQEAGIWGDRRRTGDVDGLLKAFDELTDTLDRVFDLPGIDTDTQVNQEMV